MARKWKKVEPDRIRHLDRRRMGVATLQPPRPAGAEGQFRAYVDPIWCPCNGDPVWVVLDPDYYQWYVCGVCGCVFEA
jgi:hypothetical protein